MSIWAIVRIPYRTPSVTVSIRVRIRDCVFGVLKNTCKKLIIKSQKTAIVYVKKFKFQQKCYILYQNLFK